jgi:protein-S-isoprenylcysteine O-methyltransferase
LILVVPLAVYDHALGLAASMPASIIWIGILFSALSILLGLLSRLYLGRSYSPSPYRRIEDAFVQTGPYRWIRHPLYTAALLWVIGWPLIMCSFRSVFLALALIIPAIIKRVQTEETEMLRQFGAVYENYCTKTCRFIPFIY